MLGLAQLAKFTCLVLYPISIVVFVLRDGDRAHDGRSKACRKASSGCDNVGPALFKLAGIWLAATSAQSHRVERGLPVPRVVLDSSELRLPERHAQTVRRTHFTTFRRLPIPLPRDYVTGLDHQRQIMEQKHPVFLDGQWSEEGFPGYYAWAILYKVPHALQLLGLFGVALDCGARRTVAAAAHSGGHPASGGRRAGRRREFAHATRNPLRLAGDSVCHPVRVAGGRLAGLQDVSCAKPGDVVLAAAMLLSLRYYPEHLSYFNEFAGGPLGGREHLLDSNLDWGQDLGGLERYLDETSVPKEPISQIGLAYFGTVPPAALGIHYSIAPANVPQPGRFAVSVNFEQGRPHWVRTPDGKIQPVNIGQFEYFGFFQPVARIGYSIDVFELTQRDVAEWHAKRNQAMQPLSSADPRRDKRR